MIGDDAHRRARCRIGVHRKMQRPRRDLRQVEEPDEPELRLPDGLVRIALKGAFSDGTVAVDMDPLSLLCRLAAIVPAPRLCMVRYSGVLASASKWRPLIIAKPQRGDRLVGGARVVRSAVPLRHHRVAPSPLG